MSAASASRLPTILDHSPCTFLCFHTVTNCKFRNSFLLIFMRNAGGVWGAFLPLPTTHHPLRTIPFLFTFLRTLLHFFALAQNSTLLLSSDSALFSQNTRGGGGAHLLQRASRRGGTLLVKLYAPQEEKGRIEVRTFTKAWQEKESGHPEGRRRSNHGLKSDKPTAGLGRVSNSGRGCTRSWTRQACRCWGRDFSRRRGPAD